MTEYKGVHVTVAMTTVPVGAPAELIIKAADVLLSHGLTDV